MAAGCSHWTVAGDGPDGEKRGPKRGTKKSRAGAQPALASTAIRLLFQQDFAAEVKRRSKAPQLFATVFQSPSFRQEQRFASNEAGQGVQRQVGRPWAVRPYIGMVEEAANRAAERLSASTSI